MDMFKICFGDLRQKERRSPKIKPEFSQNVRMCFRLKHYIQRLRNRPGVAVSARSPSMQRLGQEYLKTWRISAHLKVNWGEWQCEAGEVARVRPYMATLRTSDLCVTSVFSNYLVITSDGN